MLRVYSIHGVVFVLRRITGVALLLYFVAHVVAISSAVLAGPQAFTAVMAAFREPALRWVEWAVVACIAVHALSGLHVIASERSSVRGLLDSSARSLEAGHAD